MAALDIAIDLGTCNMIVATHKKGIISREPSIVAMDNRKNKVIGVGQKVQEMVGREHSSIDIIYPLSNGVISNYNMTQVLTKFLFKQAGRNPIFKSRVVTCIPCGTTTIEASSLSETLTIAGARSVFLIEEPTAAALGIGLDLSKPIGRLIVDIGGGTADAAVLSMGGVVSHASCRSAGNAFDEAIELYLRKTANMIIGKQTAEQIKKEIASVWTDSPEATMEVRGRSSITNLPTRIPLKRSEIYPVLHPIALGIVHCIQEALELIPPELASDIHEMGLHLTGGGALMTGMPELLQEKIGVPTHVPEEPLDSVIRGILKSFSYIGVESDVFYDPNGQHYQQSRRRID